MSDAQQRPTQQPSVAEVKEFPPCIKLDSAKLQVALESGLYANKQCRGCRNYPRCRIRIEAGVSIR